MKKNDESLAPPGMRFAAIVTKTRPKRGRTDAFLGWFATWKEAVDAARGKMKHRHPIAHKNGEFTADEAVVFDNKTGLVQPVLLLTEQEVREIRRDLGLQEEWKR